MLKKFISILVLCTMLTGLFIPAYAETTKTYDEYVMVDGTEWSHGDYIVSKKYNGFIPGDSIVGKIGDNVYKISNTGESGMVLRKQNITTIYNEGEKVHLSTEIMVPTGTTFNKGPFVSMDVYIDSAAKASENLAVSNLGWANKQSANIITFSPNYNRIVLFGDSVYTNKNWEYDRWYKIDVVLVMGDSPKAAIYLDGEPLTIDMGFGNGNPIHDDRTNATFDGIKTSSDYVDVGYKNSNNVFVSCGIYGVKNFSVGAAGGNANGVNTIYLDNLSYKGMSAADYPVIDSAFGLTGIADGATVDRAELDAARVNVPAWFAHQTSKVTLSIDGASALEDASAPYTFDLSTIERGVRHLTLTAYDANGDAIKEAVRTLVVAGNESKVIFSDDYETTGEIVTDSDGVSKIAKKLSSTTKRTDYTFGDGTTTYNKGLLTIEYDMYLDNHDITTLTFARRSGHNFISWDATNSKLKAHTDGGYGVAAGGSFTPQVKKWQHWIWYIDFAHNGQVTLAIDGEQKLEKVAMKGWNTDDTKHHFLNFLIQLQAGSAQNNYIALDNVKVTHSFGIAPVYYNMYDCNNNTSWSTYTVAQMQTKGLTNHKYVAPTGNYSKIYAGKIMNAEGTAALNETFGDSIICEFSSSDAYLNTPCAIPFTYGANKNKHAYKYGDMVAEFDFYVENNKHNNVVFKLDWAPFATITNENLVKVENTSTGFYITPGQWHRFKFMLDYNYGDSFYVRLFVDGNEIFYGKATSTYKFANTYNPSHFNWCITPEADSADSSKYAANKMAIDNISFSFEPVTPYISSVDFGSENSKTGLVLAGSNSATVKVSGIPSESGTNWVQWADSDVKKASVLSKIKLIDLETNSAVDGVNVSAAVDTAAKDIINVTLSGLNLKAGKQYKIVLDSGVGFDYYYAHNSASASLYYSTNEPSSFVFTAVDSFDEEAAPDDGVAGDITVTDVRFTTNKPNAWGANILTGYTGGTIDADKELRADVMVNNASESAQKFRIAIATYSNGELTGISLGEECTLMPNAQSQVFTSGKISITEAQSPNIKVMIINNTDNIVPVSKAFSLEN